MHSGGISANATSYGNPIEFSPSERPALAVDGDVSTAWRTGAFSEVEGERLVLTMDEAVAPGSITLIAPQDNINRWVTRVRLRFDGGDTMEVDLGASFRSSERAAGRHR